MDKRMFSDPSYFAPKKRVVFSRMTLIFFPYSKIPKIKDSIYREEIKNIIMEKFSNHPGELDGMKIPCNRNEAKKWLKLALELCFRKFDEIFVGVVFHFKLI